MKSRRWIGIVLALLALLLLAQLHRHHVLGLEYLQERERDLLVFYTHHPWVTRAAFLLVGIGWAALSMPAISLTFVAAGATFGFGWGLLLAAVGASIGATLSFWSARFLFRDALHRRFGERLEVVHRGIARNGNRYLFCMRLTPVLPFFVINLAMGLTHMRSLTFYCVTQFGMLAPVAVYVNAGQQLSRIHALSDIFNPAMLVSFGLLALLPLTLPRLISWLGRPNGWRGA